MNDEEPVDPVEGDDGRDTCPECGKRVARLTQHLQRQHPDAPRGARGRPRKQFTAPKPKGPAGSSLPSLEQELTITYAFIAQAWGMRDPFCAGVMMQQVPHIAKAWNIWAQSSPSVHRIISQMLAGSGATAVLLAHVPLVMAIMHHHGPQSEAPAATEGESVNGWPEPGTGPTEPGPPSDGQPLADVPGFDDAERFAFGYAGEPTDAAY